MACKVVMGLNFGLLVTAWVQISKCPVGKEKIAVAILTTSRLRMTVNWLQQNIYMFHPLCWSDDAYSDQIFKQNTHAVVAVKFHPLCGHQTKISFLGMIIKMLPFCNETCTCGLS